MTEEELSKNGFFSFLIHMLLPTSIAIITYIIYRLSPSSPEATFTYTLIMQLCIIYYTIIAFINTCYLYILYDIKVCLPILKNRKWICIEVIVYMVLLFALPLVTTCLHEFFTPFFEDYLEENFGWIFIFFPYIPITILAYIAKKYWHLQQ